MHLENIRESEAGLLDLCVGDELRPNKLAFIKVDSK